jgi:hypothetical protein
MKSSFTLSLIFYALVLTHARSGEIFSQFEAEYKFVPRNREKSLNASRKFDQIHTNDTGITEIGIERTPCLGECPVYTAIIRADATFRFLGEANVPKQGEYVGTVSESGLTSLFQFIRDSGYFSLEDEYRLDVSDQPAVLTYVVMNGKKKIIHNEGGAGPSKLWAIEQLIDLLLRNAEWKEK